MALFDERGGRLSFAILFSSLLQIGGENRSRPQAAKQVCEKWTLTEFPVLGFSISAVSRFSPVARAFVSAGYKPNTVASNMPINGGLLMFRGSDDKGRTTILILRAASRQARTTSAF